MLFTIRDAKTSDFSSVLNLIEELAIFENEPNAVDVSVEELQNDYNNNQFSCLVAEVDNKIVGVALYYNRYSTWKGKTIHLEDLIVNDKYRRNGIGKGLLKEVVEKAKAENLRRVEWCVLDWNTNAIKFYESVGGEILKDWYLVQLDKNGIENF